MDECESANASKNERERAREEREVARAARSAPDKSNSVWRAVEDARGGAHFVPRGSCQPSRLVSGMREGVSFQFCAKIDRENSRESNSVLEGR